jgi:hypothetical protein
LAHVRLMVMTVVLGLQWRIIKQWYVTLEPLVG